MKHTEGAYDHVHVQLSKQKVLGSNETGAIIDSELQWMWTWQNKMISFLAAATSRGFCVVERLIDDGISQCIMVSDRLATQLK